MSSNLNLYSNESMGCNNNVSLIAMFVYEAKPLLNSDWLGKTK